MKTLKTRAMPNTASVSEPHIFRKDSDGPPQPAIFAVIWPAQAVGTQSGAISERFSPLGISFIQNITQLMASIYLTEYENFIESAPA